MRGEVKYYGYQNNLDWQGRYFYARMSMGF